MTATELAICLEGSILKGGAIRVVVAPWPGGGEFRQLRAWVSYQSPDGLVVVPPAARPYVLERIRWFL